MNLVIDIGNTNTKHSVFENDNEIFFESSLVSSMSVIENILKEYSSIDKCILSATGHIPEGFINAVTKLVPYFIEFKQNTPLPFKSKYETQKTLGLDRIAAVAGALSLYKGENVLIIDAGTAITYDFKNENDEYLGGNISPGMNLRFKALHEYTEKLPMVKPSEEIGQLGTSTQKAILNGVINGIIFEMEGSINSIQENYTNLTVLLTGGDSQFFDHKLKKTIFVVRKLVSLGLNTILNYNVAIN